ncbi:MAG: hypothetical protein PUB09_02720 [Firmicutes bacterium]|nr:hypothetical protein [Bacillota bacterium]
MGIVSKFKVYSWRDEMRGLAREKGVGPRELCEYLGEPVKDKPAFWSKMPHKRETFIGIGMALKLPLEDINRWIAKYGDKKKLYVKDVIRDLAWVYLINANVNDTESDTNYYQKYEICRDLIDEVYDAIWQENIAIYVETVNLDAKISDIEYDHEFSGLVKFIRENLGAINTAYARPRRILSKYVDEILRVLNENSEVEWCLNSLRGEYLNDSMINYLTGDPNEINVIDRKTRKKTSGVKMIPSAKRTHIDLCVALGMTTEDINDYLEQMGYAAIDASDESVKRLIEILDEFEEDNPLVRKFKKQRIYGRLYKVKPITKEEELQAVKAMLGLRNKLVSVY